MLLLARSAGEWWDQLRRDIPDALGSATVSALPSLALRASRLGAAPTRLQLQVSILPNATTGRCRTGSSAE
jgi:hypothetical protein